MRLAMRHGCTIVPFAALGVDDAFEIGLDSQAVAYTRPLFSST